MGFRKNFTQLLVGKDPLLPHPHHRDKLTSIPTLVDISLDQIRLSS